jgi:hypothetical protein
VAESIITQKLGPLPLVVWVIGGSGAVLLFVMMTHKGNNGAQANTTNSVSALAPTEAEAFGTLEQQQQDVSNALTTLGQNQAALGGSMSTLAGTVTQGNTQNAASFQSLLDALSGVSGQVSGVSGQVSGVSGQVSGVSGQVSDASAAASRQASDYNTTLLNQLANWFANLSTTVVNGDTGLSRQVSSAQNSINSVSGQVGSLSDLTQSNTAYLANLDQAGINATWSQFNNVIWNLQHPPR